jgi:hypothetical protein
VRTVWSTTTHLHTRTHSGKRTNVRTAQFDNDTRAPSDVAALLTLQAVCDTLGNGTVRSISAPKVLSSGCTFKCKLAGVAKHKWTLSLVNPAGDVMDTSTVTMEHGNVSAFRMSYVDSDSSRSNEGDPRQVLSRPDSHGAHTEACVVTTGMLCTKVEAVDAHGNVVSNFSETYVLT